MALQNRASEDDVIVLKFGSSVLRTSAGLPNVVHENPRYRRGCKLVAVVSAIELTTEALLSEARRLSPTLGSIRRSGASGNRGALFSRSARGCTRSQWRAGVLNPREIELIASGGTLDRELVSVSAERVRHLPDQHRVLVVPGFFGDRRPRQDSRAGARRDLTAVFLAQAVDARCRLINDVDSGYESDPASTDAPEDQGAQPRRFAGLSHADGIRVAG